MAKKINTANILAGLDSVQAVTESLSTAGRLENVPAALIRLHSNNTAAKNDTPESIEELASSIEASGLIHPLAVNKVSDTEFVLMSGERRYKAITTHLHWSTIPCTVYERLDSDSERLVLLTANLDARQYTAQERLELYMQLDSTLRAMKESGKYKGAIQKGIAGLMGISVRQVRKYSAASRNLSDTKEELSSYSEDREEKEEQRLRTGSYSGSGDKKEELSSSFEGSNPILPKPITNIAKAAKSDVYPNIEQLASSDEWRKYIEEAILWEHPDAHRYYTTHCPAPKDAIKWLKPHNGYSGSSRDFSDGTWGHTTWRSNRVDISAGNGSISLTYSTIDSFIRRMIAEGTLTAEPEEDPLDMPIEPELLSAGSTVAADGDGDDDITIFEAKATSNMVLRHIKRLMALYPDEKVRNNLSQAHSAIARFQAVAGLLGRDD